jgi:hypothetical protein
MSYNPVFWSPKTRLCWDIDFHIPRPILRIQDIRPNPVKQYIGLCVTNVSVLCTHYCAETFWLMTILSPADHPTHHQVSVVLLAHSAAA